MTAPVKLVVAVVAIVAGLGVWLATAAGRSSVSAPTRAARAAGPAERPGPAGRCEAPDGWARLLEAHVRRYPRIEIADAYKLLHQATLGSEHAVTSREAAAQWLAEELSDLGVGPEEPLVDPLGAGPQGAAADGTDIVRIHLRPFTARGGSVERLADAFFETASIGEGDPAGLECALDVLVAPLPGGAWPWDPASAAAYVAERRAEGFPAVHHSDAYREAYRPAYRVVAAGLEANAIEGVRP